MPEPEVETGEDVWLPKAVRCVVLISSNPHPMAVCVAARVWPLDARQVTMVFRKTAAMRGTIGVRLEWGNEAMEGPREVRWSAPKRRFPSLSLMHAHRSRERHGERWGLRHPALRVGRRMLRVQYGNSNSPREKTWMGWTGPRRGHAVSSTGWKG